MAKNKTLDVVLKFIKEQAIQSCIVDKVILFGSRARGSEKAQSDYDLAIKFKSDTDHGLKSKFLLTIIEEAPTLCKLDLVDMDGNLESLLDSIQKDGITIFP